MATMKDIIQSPLLLALVIGGLLYISAFSLVYLKKAYDHCLELGITRKELSNVIKSSLIFSVVPSLSIVVGLFVLIAVLGSVWAWWRLDADGRDDLRCVRAAHHLDLHDLPDAPHA